uniref:Uncharacterized protein n=1 Tax=Grammatophora oceanica TaxID=210454 RepID=A0A7S1UT24_9STRA
MSSWFKSSNKLSPKQQAKVVKQAKKDTKKEIRGGQREMTREIQRLDVEEKKLVAELKRRAKRAGSNKDTALKALAKQLVSVRSQRDKCYQSRERIGAMGMQANGMATQLTAASALGSVSQAMGKANAAVDTNQMMQMLGTFSRETEKMEVKQEMMDDALIDAFDNDEIEEEADEVTSQVLAELGVELDGQMMGLNTPTSTPYASGSSYQTGSYNSSIRV